MAMPILFSGEHLNFFELTPATLSAASLRSQYVKYVLKYHPDKTGGQRDMRFEQTHEYYKALLDGLQTFDVWHKYNPELTLADTSDWNVPPTGNAASSTAQPAGYLFDLVREMAPSWHASNMRYHTVDFLEDALREISFAFQHDVADMAASLRNVEVGQAGTFYLCGAVQPAEPRFHGTSWKGLIGILTRGWLPSWGAGRADALARFKVDLPVVYTSSVYDAALWYPVAMVDATGKRIGERVACDVPPLRIVLICKADVTKRRIKIRRRRGNKQDAWLPEDLEICGVSFHMMSAAANDDAANDDEPEFDLDNHEPRAGVWAEPSADVPDDEMVVTTLVARQLMLMRIHQDDPRSNGDIAYDVEQLVRLRDQFVREHNLCWWTPLSPDQMKTIFNDDLKALFAADRDETVQPWKKQKVAHSIFRVWLRERFGHIDGIRATLKEPCCWTTYRELEYRQNEMLES